MYQETLDKIEFSFSALHEYEQCPLSFYERKISDTEVNEGNYYTEVGTYVHDITAKIIRGELNIDDAIDYFIDNYENNVVYKAKQSTVEAKYNLSIDFFAAFDIDLLKNYEVLGVEKEVLFELEGYKFIGFIDLLLKDKTSGEILLIDHKSLGHFLKNDGKPLKNQLPHFNAYKKQMYLYAKSVYEEYGVFPTRIIWNHFFERTITKISFNEKDYKKSLKWAIDTIHKIYSDKEFKAMPTFMLCKILCGYRNSCAYAKEVILNQNISKST